MSLKTFLDRNNDQMLTISLGSIRLLDHQITHKNPGSKPAGHEPCLPAKHPSRQPNNLITPKIVSHGPPQTERVGKSDPFKLKEAEILDVSNLHSPRPNHTLSQEYQLGKSQSYSRLISQFKKFVASRSSAKLLASSPTNHALAQKKINIGRQFKPSHPLPQSTTNQQKFFLGSTDIKSPTYEQPDFPLISKQKSTNLISNILKKSQKRDNLQASNDLRMNKSQSLVALDREELRHKFSEPYLQAGRHIQSIFSRQRSHQASAQENGAAGHQRSTEKFKTQIIQKKHLHIDLQSKPTLKTQQTQTPTSFITELKMTNFQNYIAPTLARSQKKTTPQNKANIFRNQILKKQEKLNIQQMLSEPMPFQNEKLKCLSQSQIYFGLKNNFNENKNKEAIYFSKKFNQNNTKLSSINIE